MAIEEKQYLDKAGLGEVINQTDARYATKDLATTSSPGLMSPDDVTKLSSVESGANKTVIDSALSSTSTNPVQNKLINAVLIEIDTAIDEVTESITNLEANKVDKVSGKGLSTEDYTTADKEKLAGIEEGANKTIVDTSLSSTSTNPVQNKVVQSAIQNLENVKANVDELPKAFYVTLTESTDNNYSADKTFTEIIEAYKNGKSVFCIYNDINIPLSIVYEDDGMIGFVMSILLEVAQIMIYSDNTVEVNIMTVDAEAVGALPADTVIPSKTSQLTNDSDFVKQNTLDAVSDELSDHTSNSDIHFTAAERTKLSGIATGANKYTHPTSGVSAGTYKSVTVDANGHVTAGTNPTTLSGYGITDAEAKGSVNTHNSSTSAHSDIRLLISDLATQVTNFLDVDDTTKDQLSEVIALIEENADSIESITSGKVNVSDIVNNLTTNVTNKPLSAAQGVVLKGLIDTLQSALDTDEANLTTHTGNTTVHITATERTNWNDAVSKEHTHSNKTVLDNTTASYTTAEQSKLSGIASGAEVNQNAFSNVKVGSTTVAADSKTDTIEFAGSNVTITGDATNDKITFSVANGTTSAKGVVQLTNSTSSTSTTTAATPNSVKSAYDLANTAKTNAATAQSAAEAAQSTADSKADAEHIHTVSQISDITVTATELNHLDGVTSNVQEQLNNKLSTSGGTLTGNLSGKYLTGTWLQTTSATDLNKAADKIAVIDSSGWIYYRTASELANDLGVTPTVYISLLYRTNNMNQGDIPII